MELVYLNYLSPTNIGVVRILISKLVTINLLGTIFEETFLMNEKITKKDVSVVFLNDYRGKLGLGYGSQEH